MAVAASSPGTLTPTICHLGLNLLPFGLQKTSPDPLALFIQLAQRAQDSTP